jgi:glycosyltransferase involved in cell wall biosynthesis
MRIAIVTETLPPNFYWDENHPVRGTEKFYVETARSLRRLGHEVDIYKDPDRKPYPTDFSYDVALLCNRRAEPRPFSNRNITWTNFAFDRPGDYVRCQYDCVSDLVVISETARKLLPDFMQKRCRVVPHGYDPGIYYPPDPKAERERLVAFTSSPDRGLLTLRRIWSDFEVEKQTGYRLVTGKYGETSISDRNIADLLRKSAFWVHPGEGKELFCLAAVEAQACGATPIVVPSGALAETVMHGYRFPRSTFAEGLVEVLSGDATMQDVTAQHIPTWDVATAMLFAPET